MFGFIKKHCLRMYTQVTEKLSSLFFKKTIDEAFFQELSDILLLSDVGVLGTKKILSHLKQKVTELSLTEGQNLKSELAKILEEMLFAVEPKKVNKKVFLFVGINGSGKTTTLAKLANLFSIQKKRVLCVAADTFRAAAVNQLETWTSRIHVDLEKGKENQDPASVVFSGCQRFKAGNYDTLLIDTAGRLQTKINLMTELGKIRRILDKHFTKEEIETVIVLDAMLGQNSLEQAKIFKEATDVNGIILSKLDGTGKGGVVFAIANEIKLPVLFVTFGEKIEDIRTFNIHEFVTDLLNF